LHIYIEDGRYSNKSVFNSVYTEYGVPVWKEGDMDISPEILYKDGVLVYG
jgi:hypothetical protein